MEIKINSKTLDTLLRENRLEISVQSFHSNNVWNVTIYHRPTTNFWDDITGSSKIKVYSASSIGFAEMVNNVQTFILDFHQNPNRFIKYPNSPKRDVISWVEIRERIGRLEDNIKNNITVIETEQDKFELDEWLRIDKELLDNVGKYSELYLIKNTHFAEYIFCSTIYNDDAKKLLPELVELFDIDISFKDIEQYMEENNCKIIQVFGETYYY